MSLSASALDADQLVHAKEVVASLPAEKIHQEGQRLREHERTADYVNEVDGDDDDEVAAWS
ncbi:MAG: hypothetical protein ACRYG8_15015 [Janthinobacterium lividum]